MAKPNRRIRPRPRPPDGPDDIAGAPGGTFPYDGTHTYADLHFMMQCSMRHEHSKYALAVDRGPPQKARSDRLWRKK